MKVNLEDSQNGYNILILGLRTDSDDNTNLNSEIPPSAIYFTLNIIPLLKGGEAWFLERARTDIANFRELR